MRSQKALTPFAAKRRCARAEDFFAEGGQDGFCKIISENTSGRLLGVHIAGGNASELIYGAAAMLANKMTVEEIKNTAFPHPTVSEAIREAVFR